MARRLEYATIVAETIADMSIAGVASFAASYGIDPTLVTVGGSALKGIVKLGAASLAGKPDIDRLYESIRNERSQRSVEIMRNALVEAMDQRPEFVEPIEALAEAVQDRDGMQEDNRLHSALIHLCDTLMQIPGMLGPVRKVIMLIIGGNVG